MTVRPKGTNDFLPADTRKWQAMENILRNLAETYGFEEIRTPIFEATELFLRGVGETTDIVNKEMYTFEDKGGRSMTLRPEATASTVRAYLEHKMAGEAKQPVKLYYTGPMFRYERPQKGRFRQFHQFGIECFGSADPALDAEIISFAMSFYRKLGLTDLEVRLNSVGCPTCRKAHKEKLQSYLSPHISGMCDDCKTRFEKNPLRLFDCKNEKCRDIMADAPTILDCLCDDCRDHLEKVKKYLEAGDIPYHIDPHLVRGLDYYTKTAFEILLTEIGAQSAVCGGGRYDGLIRDLGGKPTPAVGFALGMERALVALESKGLAIGKEPESDVYFIALGEEGKTKAFALLLKLREAGLCCDMDYLDRSMKSQMKAADRCKAKFAVIIGDDELAKGVAVLRNMATSEQKEIPLTDVVDSILTSL